MRNVISLAVLFAVACGVAAAQMTAKESAKAETGKPAPAFTLMDTDGKPFDLASMKDKVIVLEWVCKDCPFSNDTPGTGALPIMKDLAKKYGEKGVVWVGIDSTHNSTPALMKAYREAKSIAHPILMDTDGKVGRMYDAKTTPHVFIINKGTLVYAGAHTSEKGDRNYIAESLDAVLSGKEVPVATTKSRGCRVKYKS